MDSDDRSAFFGDLAKDHLTVSADDGRALSPEEMRRFLEPFNRYGVAVIRLTSHEDLRAQFLGLSALFGRVVRHTRSTSDCIAEVAPLSSPDSTNTAQPALAPHTDGAYDEFPPRIMALLCREPAATGGDTLLASGKALLKHIYSEMADDMDCLFSDDALTVRRVGRDSTGPIFFSIGGERFGIRFRDDETSRFGGGVRMARVLDRVRRFLSDERHVVRFRLMPNEVVVTDNFAVLHGRSAFLAAERLMWRLHFDGAGTHVHGMLVGFRAALAADGNGSGG